MNDFAIAILLLFGFGLFVALIMAMSGPSDPPFSCSCKRRDIKDMSRNEVQELLK